MVNALAFDCPLHSCYSVLSRETYKAVSNFQSHFFGLFINFAQLVLSAGLPNNMRWTTHRHCDAFIIATASEGSRRRLTPLSMQALSGQER